jgi:hypothetical protein
MTPLVAEMVRLGVPKRKARELVRRARRSRARTIAGRLRLARRLAAEAAGLS